VLIERGAGICAGSLIIARGVKYVVRYLQRVDKEGKEDYFPCVRLDNGDVVVGEGVYFRYGEEVDLVFLGPVFAYLLPDCVKRKAAL
jgi:hypothetical protein